MRKRGRFCWVREYIIIGGKGPGNAALLPSLIEGAKKREGKVGKMVSVGGEKS